MIANRYGAESKGARLRAQPHPHRPSPGQVPQAWRVWLAMARMLALIPVCVMTDGLSFRPRHTVSAFVQSEADSHIGDVRIGGSGGD